MADRKTQVAVAELVELESPDLLDQLIDSAKPTSDAARDRVRVLIQAFLDEVVDASELVADGVSQKINEKVAEIDRRISLQLDEVLHHEEFQRLEASWRSLYKLVMGTETGEFLHLRVLNVSKQDLVRDFKSAAEFTESALWKQVYENEFGMFKGDPFGALIGDYEFGKSAPDVALLGFVCEVAAAAHAPFISAASAQMFGMDSYTELMDPRDLQKKFDKNNPENTKWLSFRDHPNSNYVGLVMPHVLRRLPYGGDNEVEEFDYREAIDAHEDYLWGNAAFDFANRITDAFARYGWCTMIRGPEGGGLVADLPIHVFKTREGDTAAKCPTEMLIPDTREKELSDLGFIGLLNGKNTDIAAFFGGNSVQRPRKYDQPEATANAKLSSQLPYLMATSRIAHYLKAICRDKVGSFMSRSECEKQLNTWINTLVLDMDDAQPAAKAKRPLRAARIDVFDDKARPGCYRARAYLRPHFQLDEISVALSLVTELPEPKGA